MLIIVVTARKLRPIVQFRGRQRRVFRVCKLSPTFFQVIFKVIRNISSKDYIYNITKNSYLSFESDQINVLDSAKLC